MLASRAEGNKRFKDGGPVFSCDEGALNAG